MACVEKYGKGFSVRYWYETETGEKKLKRVSGFRTRAEAWAAAKDLEDKSNAGINVNGGSMSCAEIMERWFAGHCAGLAATTRAKYSAAIDKLEGTFIGELEIRKLNSQKFNLLMTELQKTVSTKTAISNTEPLRLSLAWAVRERQIPINPLENIQLPKTQRRPHRILSDADVQELISAATSPARRCTDYRIPLLLALYGGLRREECAGLRWENVNFENDQITVCEAITMTPDGKHHEKDPKTDNSARTVTMPAWVMDELLTEYKKFLRRSNIQTERFNPGHRVCVKANGKPYSCASYSHPLKRLISEINEEREKLNLPRMPEASFHDLRHTHAAMLIRMNIQPKVISERLGHSSIKMTMDTYGYLMPGLQQTVADAFNREYEKRKKDLAAIG